ncbi:hypothetical protein [Streptomyces globisporus]|uniref:hypothetical protein n=1 Tax=Streptomyces globisporus TaxID=1908 RepID=UPI00386EB0A9
MPPQLKANAQAALMARGVPFVLSGDGSLAWVHPAPTRIYPPLQDRRGQARAVVPGRSDQDLRALLTAAAAARAPGGPGGSVHAPTPLPRVEVPDTPSPQLAALAQRVPTPPNLPGTPTPGTHAARYHQAPHGPQPTRGR